MDTADRVESVLWPWVESIVGSWDVPGVAIAVVRDGDRAITRGFGTRDRTTGERVTPDTLFHLASVSKTFVATAVLQLVESGHLDLEAGITSYLPDLPWTDPRATDITIGHLLSHTSGLGDTSDYGWHEPELDDGALARFAAQVAGWTLEREPGAEYAYSNAAYELLGHLVATVGGQTFERHLKQHVLDPVGMTTSTFLRAEVPAHLGAGPHLALPPRVLPGTYPYTRSHSPSSTLHSSAAELGRWMVAHLAGGAGLMTPATHEETWRPRVGTADDGMHEQMALGWFRGTYRDHSVVGHSGSDPGFQANLALLPDLGIGVTVLVNANTAPVFGLTRAALDVLLGHEPEEAPPPPVTVPLTPVFASSGVAAALEHYRVLAAEDPLTVDLDEEGFEETVWGVIEMHRTDLAWPLLELWTRAQPDSSQAWFMTGWAHQVDARQDLAIEHLRSALELDPDNDAATTMLCRLASQPTPPTGRVGDRE